MTPQLPNLAVVERRLALQRDLLGEMRNLQPLSVDKLTSEPVVRAALGRESYICRDSLLVSHC